MTVFYHYSGANGTRGVLLRGKINIGRIMQTGWAKKITTTAIIVCATFMMSASIVAEVRKEDAGFHPPQTRQEKWLDAVLQEAEKQEPSLTLYMLGKSDVKPAAKSFADKNFSPDMLAQVKSQEIAEIQKNCGGVDRSDEICGTDYIPYLCVQDVLKLSYNTINDSAGKTVIDIRTDNGPKPAATYTIINGKIAGIKCYFE